MSDRTDFGGRIERDAGLAPGLDAVWRQFEDLASGELYALLRLRSAVFVVEQNCPFAEIDGRDDRALHFMVRTDAGSELAGCLRVFAPEARGRRAQIGRVATAAQFRGRGLGRWMMHCALAEIEGRFGKVPIEVSAQAQVESFYARLGFERVSDDYLEDGIVHCDMRRCAGAS